ncbi:DNRLRE domain-containing protein [Clostridium folliculivorans]|uniref:Uncharacterized protein n=1 Tax=Clostridium folliculivorans TaxID=2886038 RepID=A0A9W5Y3K6_9CLOT|nr:DNRLRE domain-containing protein [Clostridium folliculivorans]GKU25993.1 hypothetical protein CFOLD11_28200 [Clostridium folliculivorans]GKU28079.1 hypothetical protein CFB3_01850 [Clostridium folliculivorans]
MASVIIPANKSITITNKLPDGNINGDTILVGSDGITTYFSYLFFDLSVIPSDVLICYAELILFKTDNFYNDVSKVFGIYPCSYFSTYTTFNNHPTIDGCMPKYFYPITSEVVAKATLTPFVSAWIVNPKRSTCIMLFGKNNDIIASFGSAIIKDHYLIPFLKVSFTPIPQKQLPDKCIPPAPPNGIPSLAQVQVTGTVAANAKYNALIDVAVKRHLTGTTDNYYVVDQYDNVGENTPLHIDKTYYITINPKPNPQDTESIIFGGSYSD